MSGSGRSPTPADQAAPGEPLTPGAALDDGTVLLTELGRSAAGESFLAEDPVLGSVVVRVLAPALEPIAARGTERLQALTQVRHRNLQQFYRVGRSGQATCLVYEFVEGQSLRSAIDERVRQGRRFSFGSVFNLLTHLCNGLVALQEQMPHGAISPDNIFVQPDGKVKLGGVGYAALSLFAPGQAATLAGGVWTAPEVRQDPRSISPAADVYALGMVALVMLTGRYPTPAEVPALLDEVESRHAPELRTLLVRCLAPDREARLGTANELRQALPRVLSSVSSRQPPAGEQGGPGAMSGQYPTIRADAPESRAAAERAPRPAVSGPLATVPSELRWVVRRDGRDLGPFAEPEIRRQLEAGEIDENTDVFDLFTQQTSPLIDVPTFSDFVLDFVPMRQKSRLASAERRDEVVRRVKRTTLVAAVLTLAVVAGLWFTWDRFLRPKPLAIRFDTLTRPVLQSEFEVSQPAYQPIAADPELVASLFAPARPGRAAAPQQPRAERRPGAVEEPEAVEQVEEPLGEEAAIDLSGSTPARKLSDAEIRDTIRSALPRMQTCFGNELASNKAFTGATVTWSVRADGRTFNIRVSSAAPASAGLEACVVRTFRALRFPRFNDLPMNLSFPFYIQ
jgi:hypothetical protein